MEKLGAVEVLEVSMMEEESKKGGEARGDGGGKKDGDAAVAMVVIQKVEALPVVETVLKRGWS